MKKETIAKRICKNFLTKKGDLTARHADIILAIFTAKPGTRHHYFAWHGYRQNISAKDYGPRFYEVLTALGLDYFHDNDAPRGGREGDYYQLTKKGENQIRETRKYLADIGVNYRTNIDPLRFEKLAQIFKTLAGVLCHAAPFSPAILIRKSFCGCIRLQRGRYIV